MRLLICTLLIFFSLSCSGQQIIQTWKVPHTCKQSNPYPIYITHTLPKHPRPSNLIAHYSSERNNMDKNIDVHQEFQASIRAWNSWGQRHQFKFFSSVMRSEAPVVRVNPAPLSHYAPGQNCELYNMNSAYHIDTMGWIEYRVFGAEIYICVEKFAHVVSFPKSSLARHLRRIGLRGFIMHELGHVIVGPYHIDDGSLMSSRPLHTMLTKPLEILIKSRVIEPCRRYQ